MKRILKRLWVTGFIVLVGAGVGDGREAKFTTAGIAQLMKRVNSYTLEHPYTPTDRNWIRATYYTGVIGGYLRTGDRDYLEQANAWAERHQWQVGTEYSGSNRLFCSMTWAELYLLEPDMKKIEPTIKWLETEAPNSPSGAEIWYGHSGPKAQQLIYSDSLYGAPVFAMLYKATGQKKYLDIMHDFFWHVTDTLWDAQAKLYYRDRTYIGKSSPHGKKIFWSRGNGWVFAAIPRILTYLPKDNSDYDRYLELYRQMAKSLILRQGDDGLWRSNLDDSLEYTMPESSGTAFFTYGLAKGIVMGLLDQATYLPAVVKGWDGLVRCVHDDGKLGWVQPVDAAPRPSLPVTTHEYAAGLFLLAGGEVMKLVETGVLDDKAIEANLVDDAIMLPPAALKDKLTADDHPLAEDINRFMARQGQIQLSESGLNRKDYLEVIAGQVKVMQTYQNAEGRIIDPVIHKEAYYATPCYAHSVAALAAGHYPVSEGLIESGMKALDRSLADLAASKAAGGHGDFFTWPVMFAYELFDTTASPERRQHWQKLIEQIQPNKLYRTYRQPYKPYEHRALYDHYNARFAANWNLVNTAGEFMRAKHGWGKMEYVDFCLAMQLPHFSPEGMYNEHGDPMPYDLFARHYITGMLQKGYRSFDYTTYRKILWKGGWTSLLMESPTGQLPTGYRSSHHIWNEAEEAVVFEIYARQYAQAGLSAQAGAFKRAAHLALGSVKRWIRPDGSGYVVKNRYPIEKRFGYEGYSEHSCYNMLACSMLAQAWEFADDAVAERPCPADGGGFAFEIPRFHKVFANAGGTYIEYDTDGHHTYNPTGLLRVHLKGGHPQLGPSEGCAQGGGSFMSEGAGMNYAVGPAWKDAQGKWVKLADLNGVRPAVEVMTEEPGQVRLRIVYRIPADKDGGTETIVTETLTVRPNELVVEDQIQGDRIGGVRVYYPMLVFDGKEDTQVVMEERTLRLLLDGKGICFENLSAKGGPLVRMDKRLKHRNGLVEMCYFDMDGNTARYRLSVDGR